MFQVHTVQAPRRAWTQGAIIALFLLFLGISQAHAQQLEMGSPPANPNATTIQAAFDQFDDAQAVSGYFLDKTLPLGRIRAYAGTHLDSVATGTAAQFGLIYNRLSAAATSMGNPLPPFLASVGMPAAATDTVPVKTLFFHYHRLLPDALAKGLVDVQNQQVLNVPGQNPMMPGQVLLAMPWVNTALPNPCHLLLDSLFTNSNQIAQLFTDLDDGAGWRPIAEGQTLAANWPSGGVKSFKLKVQLANGQAFYAKSEVSIQEPAAASRSYTDPFELPIAGATVSVLSACGDESICKPLILIEGFNAGIVGDDDFDKYKNKIGFEGTGNLSPTSNSLLSELEYADYDLVYIDFDDGTASLFSNVEVVKAVIREVNLRKAASGCVSPNVVIGFSMGGILGKMAIRQMELNGELHDCQTLYTFDSPLRGANVSLGLQYFVDHLANMTVMENTTLAQAVPLMADAIAALNSPAAKEILLYHYADFPNKAPEHIALFDYMRDIGGLSDCEHVAISNGSQIGNGQGFEPNARLFGLYGNLAGILAACAFEAGEGWLGQVLYNFMNEVFDVIDTDVELDFEVRAVPSAAQGNQLIYKGDAEFEILGLEILGLEPMEVRVSGTLPLDGAPGGYIQALTEPIPICSGTQFAMDNSTLCFVPTISALEIGPFVGGNQPYADPFMDVSDNQAVLSSGLTSVNRFIAWDNPIPAGSPADEFNQYHLGFSTDNLAVLLYDLRSIQRPYSPMNNGTFNFGQSEITEYDYTQSPPPLFPYKKTGHFIPGQFTIAQNGKIWINRAGRIGYTHSMYNPNVLTSSSFEVYLGGHAECIPGNPARTTVKQGGSLDIGDMTGANNMGQLIAEPESALVIGEQGTITVDAGSKILIKPGATLHVQSGGTLRIKGAFGAVTVMEGGQVLLDEGANLVFEHPESVLDIHGTLVVNGDFNFSGLGYINYAGNLEFGPSATRFRLVGQLPYHRCLRTEKPLTVPLGKDLFLSRGAVECIDQGLIALGGGVQCSQFKFSGSGTGLKAVGMGAVTVKTCLFTDIEQPFVLEAPTGGVATAGNGNVRIEATTLTNFFKGAEVSKRNEVRFLNCSINNTQPMSLDKSYGVFLNDNYSTLFRNCTISGISRAGVSGTHLTGMDVLADAQLAEGIRINGGFQFWMHGGSITHCDVAIGSRPVTFGAGQHLPPNILMTEHATLANCLAGVCAEGNQKNGVVIATCARFVENEFALAGRDMLLMIDHAQLNATPQYAPYPNHFVLPGYYTQGGNQARFVSMCYVQKFPGMVSAANNFWGGYSPWSATPNDLVPIPGTALPVFFDVWHNTSGNCNAVPNVSVITAPTATEPRDCWAEAISCTDACVRECTLETVGQNEPGTVRQQFMDGINGILSEAWEGGAVTFEPVSALWQPELPSTMPNECRTFIQAARSFVEGAAGRSYQSVANTPVFQLAPNPTNGWVSVIADQAVSQLYVMDGLGRTVLVEKEPNWTPTFSTQGWPKGMYFVYVSVNGLWQAQRLIVQ